MTRTKPLASVSLDLDDKWTYLKTHGDSWEGYPSYLDIAIPRILDFLKKRNLTITFFIVGQDAALERNHTLLRMIAQAGHEISNHSFHHEPWLHLYSEDEIEADLRSAQEYIQQATGRKPIGFRGPGYALSLPTLKVLNRLGYVYDCSTFPTILGPLARLYYFMTAHLTDDERTERARLFGNIGEGLRPNKPYHWQLENTELIEIPVTTMPFFKVPIHVNYILYLDRFSRRLAVTYFRFALLMFHVAGVQPSILLHPLDFLGCDDTSELDFFPAMRVQSETKIELVDEILGLLAKDYQIVPMCKHAQEIAQDDHFPTIPPKFEV